MSLLGDVCGEQVGESGAQAVLDDAVLHERVTGENALAQGLEQLVGHAFADLAHWVDGFAGGEPFVGSVGGLVRAAVLQEVVGSLRGGCTSSALKHFGQVMITTSPEVRG